MFPMHTRSNGFIAIGFLMLSFAFAQDSARSQESAAPSGDAGAASISAEESISAARSLLVQVDSAVGEVDREAVREELDRYIAAIQMSEPGSPWLKYLVGRGYAMTGRTGEAIDLLQDFVETREGRNEWRAFRALGDLLVGQFPRLAQSQYQRASLLVGEEPGVVFGMSQCARGIGDFDGALRLARRAVELDRRRRVSYLRNLALLAARNREWAEARRAGEDALNRAKEAMEAGPVSLESLALVDQQYQVLIEVLNRQLESVEDSEVIGSLAVDLSQRIEQRGAFGARVGLFDAMEKVRSAVERAGDGAPISLLDRFAELLSSLSREDEARDVYGRILKLDPDHAGAKAALAGGGGADAGGGAAP